jgi:hypothetical protein
LSRSDPPKRPDRAAVRGWTRLAFDAAVGLAGVVEAMHAEAAAWLPALRRASPTGRTRGVTGLVYRAVRAVARLAGDGVDLALARAGDEPDGESEGGGSARPELLRAVLNGVVGDHLAATSNPLAIPMELRRDGRPLVLERAALAAALPDAGARPLVLVHGSCRDDVGWRRDGHDHGAALARDLGCTPVYLRYNTGLHVSTNGAALSDLLGRLVEAWPVPFEGIAILAHSMGGLVVRSALHRATGAGAAWPGLVSDVIFLGTPHHGAPLERGGTWVDAALGLERHSAPLAALGKIRSAGVTDLRHGSLLDEDWRGRDRFARALPRPVPLPVGPRCYAVAATLVVAGETGLADRLVGDGLVPVDSALGRHADPARELGFPATRRWVGRGLNHVDLLSRAEVYERVRSWLEGAAVTAATIDRPAASPR